MWDEYTCLQPISTCDCGAANTLAEIENKHKLMQFLMGLNESYDCVRNQILITEPLPIVNKAYSMILRIEKRREAHNNSKEYGNNAMTIRSLEFFKEKGGKSR